MNARPTLLELYPRPDDTRKLETLVGVWSAAGTLSTAGRNFALTGRSTITSAAAGWGVLILNRFDIELLGPYEEVAVLGYDQDERAFHFFALTNTAAAYDHTGGWLNERTLGFVHQGRQGQKSYLERITAELLAPDELAVFEEDFLAGRRVRTLDVRLKRAA